jgi:glucosylceramidase
MKNILLLSALFFALGLKAQNVKLITSTADRTKVFETGKTKAAKSATGTVVKLDPTVAFQTMDGFGAAVTGSTCYNLLRMEEKDRNDFLVKTFSHKKGLGFSYIRISIGCSDFSLNEYTCCDEKGIENFRFSWEDTNNSLPV